MGKRIEGADAAERRAAAAAAARRAAAEEARRAAEAEARRLAAAAAAEKARARTPSRDELSNGRGSAAVRKGRSVTGADALPAQVRSSAPTFSLRDLQRRTVSADAAEAQGPQLPARYASADSLERQSELDSRRLNAATAAFETAVNEETPLAAAEQLTESLEALPAEQRGDFLADSAESLEQLTENITGLDQGETADVVAELARAAEVAGPAHVEELTRPLAKAIADGRLEQTGSSANGGPGGIFHGANTHNSERELIDGIDALEGHDLFRDSLAASLSAEAHGSSGGREDRALGFAAAVITGDSDQVPDGGVWTRARELGSDVVGLVEGAVERISDLREAVADRALDAVLGISDSLESLEPGDTFTLGAHGAVSAELHGEFEDQLQVTRNDDGTYTVAGSSSVLAGIGAADNRVAAGGGGVVEFTFENLEEAKDGVQALAKIALTGVLPVIAGLSLPSPGELLNLGQSISAVQLNGEAAAGLDARFGLSGLQGGGAEGALGATVSGRIEFEGGRPTAVVASYELSATAAAEASNLLQRFGGAAVPDGVIEEFREQFGFDPLDVQGIAETSGSIHIEVRTPIDTTPVEGGNPLEQAAALLAHPERLAGGAPEVNITLSGEAEAGGHGLAGEVNLEGLDLSQAGTFVSRLAEGDLEGAIAATGATHTFEYHTFEDDSRGWLDHGLDVAVASVGGTNVVRHVGESHETEVAPSADGTRLEVVS